MDLTGAGPEGRGGLRHHVLLTSARAASVVACVALLLVAPARAARVELLSLAGLRLSAGEFVSGFELQTWTVTVLAVCRLPVGWTVTAGNGGDPGGVLSGSANIGAAFVGKAQLGAFGSLFLVRIGQYRTHATGDVNGAHAPATFAGAVTIGRYGEDATRQAELSGGNVRRHAATRCPAPGG